MSHYKMFMEQQHKGFFDLSLKEQEQLKRSNPKWGEKYEVLLYKLIFGLSGYSIEELNEMELDPVKELEFNKQKLKYYGSGEDLFQLVSGYEDKTSSEYGTLYNFDHGLYKKQLEATKKALGDAAPTPAKYRLVLLDVFARCMIEEEDGSKEFKYLFINSLETYIAAELESESIEIIEHLVPHEYIETSEYGKRIEEGEESYNLLSYTVDAGGKEYILKDLQQAARDYLGQKETEIRAALSNNEVHKVFLKEIKDELGDELYYFVTTPEAAKKIEFDRWNKSMKLVLDPDFSQVDDWILEETLLFKDFLIAKHKELEENFNPNIKRMDYHKPVEIAVSDEHLRVLADMVEAAEYEAEHEAEIKAAKEKLEKKNRFKIVKPNQEDE